MQDIYPDNVDYILKKECDHGFEELDEAEKIVFAIWKLEAEVNNGGFAQYFFNSSDPSSPHIIEYLDRIRAHKSAMVCREAIEVAYAGKLPGSWQERQDLLDDKSELVFERLHKLDMLFYKYQNELAELVNQFIKDET